MDNTNTRHYELMYIISTRLSDKEIENKYKSIKNDIEKISTKITADIDMGIMDLAYKIKGQTKGLYKVITFMSDPKFINDLKNKLTLDLDILRYLLIKIPDDHILDEKMMKKSEKSKKTESKNQEMKSDDESKSDKKVKVRKRVLDRQKKEEENKEKESKKVIKKSVKKISNNNAEKRITKNKDVDDLLDKKEKLNEINDLTKKLDDLLNNL